MRSVWHSTANGKTFRRGIVPQTANPFAVALCCKRKILTAYLREGVRRLHGRHVRVLPVGDLHVPAGVDEAGGRRQAAVDDVDAVKVPQTRGDVRRQGELEVVVQLVVVVLAIEGG